MEVSLTRISICNKHSLCYITLNILYKYFHNQYKNNELLVDPWYNLSVIGLSFVTKCLPLVVVLAYLTHAFYLNTYQNNSRVFLRPINII